MGPDGPGPKWAQWARAAQMGPGPNGPNGKAFALDKWINGYSNNDEDDEAYKKNKALKKKHSGLGFVVQGSLEFLL